MFVFFEGEDAKRIIRTYNKMAAVLVEFEVNLLALFQIEGIISMLVCLATKFLPPL